MELILLAALGLSALSMVFGGDDATTNTPNGAGQDDDVTNPPDNNTGKTIDLISGEPNPAGTAGSDTFMGIIEGSARGGAGDDSFSFENGYGAVISGGVGDDSFVGGMGDSFTLHGDAGNDLFAFDTGVFDGAVAYGGAGDDRFDLEFADSDVQPGAILSGGDGADIYDLTFSPGMADRAGGGKMVTIKDFKLGEDQLNVTFADLDRAELVENPDGNSSDINLHYVTTDDSGATVDRYMQLRLEGITGATVADFGLPAPDDGTGGTDSADLILLREATTITTGGGDDTIRAADGFENEAMDGLRIDAGAGDDEIDVTDLIGGQIINGNAGNDRIIGLAGTSSIFRGGEGDDTIIGGGSHALYGDGGDDLLQVGSSALLNGVSADGGEGDDRIVAEVELGRPDGFRPPFATGGVGADTFDLRITSVTDPATVADGDSVTYQGLQIEDFDSTQDRLVLDLTTLEASEPTVEALDITTTGVAIIFSNGARGFITCNTQGLQQGDIEILSRQTAA